MTLNDYQESARLFAIYPNQKSVDGLVYAVLALNGEAGELANKLKKHLRAGTPVDRAVLADELGDVLWYVASTARELGYGLSEIAQMNLDKLDERRMKRAVPRTVEENFRSAKSEVNQSAGDCSSNL